MVDWTYRFCEGISNTCHRDRRRSHHQILSTLIFRVLVHPFIYDATVLPPSKKPSTMTLLISREEYTVPLFTSRSLTEAESFRTIQRLTPNLRVKTGPTFLLHFRNN